MRSWIRSAAVLCGALLVLGCPATVVAGPQPPAGAKTAEAAAADLPWRLVGPFRGGWAEMVVGAAEAPDTFYFGAAGGGVWGTGDAGRTWTPLFDGGADAAVGAIAVAPSDPKVIYIGEGQPEPRYDVAAGRGVYKSLDAGKTWRSMGLADTRAIGRIWVDPGDPNKVLVAAVGDFFAASGTRGVYRSADGGATWAQTLQIAGDAGVVDLAADQADPRVIFAAAWQARQFPWQSYYAPINGPLSGIYRSADGGVSWRRMSAPGWPAGPLGRISLAATRKNGLLRLYSVVSAGKQSGLYRSDDGAHSWRRVNAEPAFAGYYASRITVAPDDPDVVYLVGQSVRRCDEGGARCVIVKGAPGGDDYHQVWINPAHPDHMATASDQGAAVSVDGGKTWSSWYNQPTGQFYHLAADEGFPYRIYAGQQDSGTVAIASRGDYGAIGQREWRSVGGDERDYEIPDPLHRGIVFGSGLGGRVSRFDARTGEVANVTPFPEPNYGRRQTTTAHHFTWVTPMAMSRIGPQTLYLGGEVVFASTDEGAHWSIISGDLTGKRPGAARCDGEVAIADARACGYGGVWSLAPSPLRAGEIWVGTDDGLVQLTRDGGAHWDNITPPGVPDWAKVASIDPSAIREGLAYVAVDGHRLGDHGPHVWRTADYGADWKEITGDLPGDHFVDVVRADPQREGLLYAGTEAGAFVSFDDGGHWRPLGVGLPTAWVRDLLVHGDDLVAATQGRAIWILGDLGLLRQIKDDGGGGGRLFAPTPAMRLRANNNHGDTPPPPEEPLGANPPAGAVIDYWLAAPAKGPVTIEIADSAGHTVATLSSEPRPAPQAEAYFADRWRIAAPPLGRAAGLNRAVWDLHYDRPPAVRYAYSIATVAGARTPVTPEGPLAAPGTCEITLKADGRRWRQPLEVIADPRAPPDLGALQASLSLSRSIAESLAVARKGYGEQQSAREQLAALATRLASEPSAERLAAEVADLMRSLEPSRKGPSFLAYSDTLAGIESDLEGTDLAPTQAQTDLAAKDGDGVRDLWVSWSATRGASLARINRDLARLHQRPLTIRAADKLVIVEPEAGEEAP